VIDFGETAAVIAAIEAGCAEPHRPPKRLGQGGKRVLQRHVDAAARQDSKLQAFPPSEEVGEIEMALALFGAQIACREQAAEAAISNAVGRPGGDVRGAVPEREPTSHGIFRAGLLCREVAANHAGEGIAIGNGEAGEAENRSRAASSSGWEAPRRNEKLDAARSSA
jgi:hypothetical protein